MGAKQPSIWEMLSEIDDEVPGVEEVEQNEIFELLYDLKLEKYEVNF